MRNQIRRTFKPGDVIFREGDSGHSAYIIERGAVQISTMRRGNLVPLAIRRTGEIFGEMAVVDSLPRSATACAVEECELLVISETQMNRRIDELDPVLRMVLNVILERLRDTIRRDIGEAPQPQPSARSIESHRPLHDYKEAIDRIELEQALSCALDKGELFLLYQPIADTQTLQILSFEALMRWAHPERGLVSPAEFIDVAADAGFLRCMTLWLINEVCEIIRADQTIPGVAEDYSISVNVSADDICDSDFFDEVSEIIARSKIDPRRITIEITETLLIRNPDLALEMLIRYRELGLSISIDDFGTGYSNLNYLARFPVDNLKIDQSFVRHIDNGDRDRSVVHAMSELGHLLGMKIIAEGVETQTHLNIIREIGCDRIQGYLLSKPRAWEEILEAPMKVGP